MASISSSSDSDTSSTSHGVRKKNQQKGFSQPVAVAFTINYLIGTGFLTLPWAFHQGGILLSTITFLFAILICNTSKNYVLCTMARAEAMHVGGDGDVDSEEDLALIQNIQRDTDGYGSVNKDEEALDASSRFFGGKVIKPFAGGNFDPLDISRDKPSNDRYIVKDRKFEYVELCRIFLGEKGEQAYIASIAISILLQLWGYTTVFSSAMAEKAPITGDVHHDYTIYTIIFASIVIPLTCLDLREQVQFQLVLSVCRLVVIFIMIVTCLVASIDAEVHFIGTEKPAGSSWVSFSGFYEMFSVLVFSMMFHNAIPVLSEPVQEKKYLAAIFRNAFIICGLAFWILGYITAWFFGYGIEQSCNLNWDAYIGGTGERIPGTSTWVHVAFWARSLSYFVVLFPAVNIVSAYPLNAIVLGNNLMVKAHGQRAVETHKHLKVVYRLIASSPPVVGALFVRQLGVITSYAGVLAIVTVLCFPALMYISSKRRIIGRLGEYATVYESVGSSEGSAIFVLVLSAAAAVYILTKLMLASP